MRTGLGGERIYVNVIYDLVKDWFRGFLLSFFTPPPSPCFLPSSLSPSLPSSFPGQCTGTESSLESLGEITDSSVPPHTTLVGEP